MATSKAVESGQPAPGEPVLVQFVRLWLTPIGVLGLLAAAWQVGEQSAAARKDMQHLTITVEKMDTRLEGVASTLHKASNGLETLRSGMEAQGAQIVRLQQRMDLIESRVRELERAK